MMLRMMGWPPFWTKCFGLICERQAAGKLVMGKGVCGDVRGWIALSLMELDPETVQGNPHGKPCRWVGFVSVAVRRRSRFCSGNVLLGKHVRLFVA